MNKPKSQAGRKKYLLYPDETFSVFWEFSISVILLYSVFLTPYQLAFPETEDEVIAFNNLLDFINAMFYCDIIINFISATSNEDNSFEDDFK